jgi:hypothetical protein
MDPQVRFRDVMPMWVLAQRVALNITHGQIISRRFATENQAINMMHKLNMARKAMRDEGVSDYDGFIVRREGFELQIHHRAAFDPTGILDGDGNPISSADIQAAIYSDPTITHKWTDEELRQVKPGDPNSLVERRIAWGHRHAEEQRLGIPVNDPNDPWPEEEDGHTRIGLHEIDPEKPLLDDIA